MDAIWPAEFAKAGIVTDITLEDPARVQEAASRSAWISLRTLEGKTYGVPWIKRHQVLPVQQEDARRRSASPRLPKTWDEVVTDAKAIKAKGLVKYPMVGSWEAGRGSHLRLGPSWRRPSAPPTSWTLDGKALFNTDGGLKALQFMKKLLDDGLMNPALFAIKRG